MCPHPVGQNQAMAPPRCKEGLGNIIVPGLAAPPQQSFWPGRGAGIFDEHRPSLPQVIGGPAGHRVFLLFMPPCSKSACNLSFIRFPGSLGSRWLVLTCTKTEHTQGYPEPPFPPLTKQVPPSLLSEASTLSEPAFLGSSEGYR